MADAQLTSEETPIERGAARDSLAAEIARRRNEQMAAENEPAHDPGLDGARAAERPEVPPAPPVRPPPHDAPAPADPPPPAPEIRPPAELVTVKVFGEERQVPKADVEEAGGVDQYQIRAAGEHLLETGKQYREQAKTEAAAAAKAREEADRYLERLRAQEEQQATAGEDGLTEDQRAQVEKLREDSYDPEFIAAREEVFRLRNRLEKAEDPRPIEKAVDERMAHREEEARRKAFEEQVESANAMFRREFSEINENPDLMEIATKRARVLVTDPENPRDLVTAARESGNYVRENYVLPLIGAQSFEDVARSKRTLQPEPTAAAGGRVNIGPEPPPKPRSHTEIIQEMIAERAGRPIPKRT